jgi:hypothetical protein
VQISQDSLVIRENPVSNKFDQFLLLTYLLKFFFKKVFVLIFFQTRTQSLIHITNLTKKGMRFTIVDVNFVTSKKKRESLNKLLWWRISVKLDTFLKKIENNFLTFLLSKKKRTYSGICFILHTIVCSNGLINL